MAMAKAKKKITVMAVMPQNQEELIDYLKNLNQAARKRENVVIRNQEKIEEIERQVAEEIKPLEEEIERWAEGIFLYCQLKRAELTDNGKTKTVSLPGELFSGDSILLR